MRNSIEFLNAPEFSRSAFPDVLTHKKSENEVYLSFEMLPGSKLIPDLIEMLDMTGQKAAFVIHGEMAETDKANIELMAQRGHEIVNGFWNQISLSELSESEIKRGIRDTDDVINTIAGNSPVFFRPPGGLFDQRVLEILTYSGHELLLWAVEPTDRAYSRIQNCIDEITNVTRGGAILRFRESMNQIKLQDILSPLLMNLAGRGLRGESFKTLLGDGPTTLQRLGLDS